VAHYNEHAANMKPIDLKYEILAWNHLNRSVDEKCSDWGGGGERMFVGFDT